MGHEKKEAVMAGIFHRQSFFLQVFVLILMTMMLIGAMYFFLGTSFIHQFIFWVSAFAALCHALFFLRLKNPAYLFLALFYALLSFTFISLQLNLRRLTVPLVVINVIFFVIHARILIRKQVRWRNGDYFKKAVLLHNGKTKKIEKGGDPRALNLKRSLLNKAALFFEKSGIMICRRSEDRIVFIIPRNMFAAVVVPFRVLQKYSNISVDSDGTVRVFLSPEDYLQYQDVLSFEEFRVALKNFFLALMNLFEAGDFGTIFHLMDGSTADMEDIIR